MSGKVEKILEEATTGSYASGYETNPMKGAAVASRDRSSFIGVCAMDDNTDMDKSPRNDNWRPAVQGSQESDLNFTSVGQSQ